MIKKIKTFIIGLLPIACLLFVPYTMYAAEDFCDNLEGVQETMPAGMSSVGSPGQCYELPPPVVIDIVPPGGAPQTIDVNPPSQQGNPQEAVVIDVNIGTGGGSNNASVSETLSDGSIVSVSTTTPSVITSFTELETFFFPENATKEEKILAIETRLVSLLKALIEVLKVELEAAIAAQNATSTPEQI